jgi:hypothetical protein
MSIRSCISFEIFVIFSIISQVYSAAFISGDIFFNNFAGTTDKTLASKNSAIIRSANYTLTHNLKVPFTFMIGISDFDTSNTKAIDVYLTNVTYDLSGSTDFKVEVGPNTGLNSMAYTGLVVATGMLLFCN